MTEEDQIQVQDNEDIDHLVDQVRVIRNKRALAFLPLIAFLPMVYLSQLITRSVIGPIIAFVCFMSLWTITFNHVAKTICPNCGKRFFFREGSKYGYIQLNNCGNCDFSLKLTKKRAYTT